jgi:hypothetical protein
VGNIQTIGGLCSQMPIEEPSIEDCLCWLSKEISGLPDMLSGVNEMLLLQLRELSRWLGI